jgi:hypothetical protein
LVAIGGIGFRWAPLTNRRLRGIGKSLANRVWSTYCGKADTKAQRYGSSYSKDNLYGAVSTLALYVLVLWPFHLV